MRKVKPIDEGQQFIVRLPRPLYERLIQRRVERTIADGRPETLLHLVIEALEKRLN